MATFSPNPDISRETPDMLHEQDLRLLGRLLTVQHKFRDPLDRQRATVLTAMSLFFSVLGLLGMFGIILVLPGLLPTQMIMLNISMALLYLGVYFLLQTGRLRFASVTFVLLTIIVPTLQSIPFPFLGAQVVALGFATSIVTSAFLLGPVWPFIVYAISMGLTTVAFLMGRAAEFLPSADSEIISFANPQVAVIAETGFLLGILTLFSWLLNSSLFSWAISAQRRSRLLEAAVVVSESAAQASSLSMLLAEVVNRIRDTYGFYHAQVFLLDRERRVARLEASTGRAGEALLARGHGLMVGSQSIIGECTKLGKPVVVNNVQADPLHKRNELLPDTAAELALPLLVNNMVIGALDVQSVETNAFSREDVRSLQLMANQLSTAIDKTRLVDELQNSAAENLRLLEDARISLTQIEDMNRRLTQEGWLDYLGTRRRGTLGYSMVSDEIRQDTGWSAAMKQAYVGDTSVVIRHDQKEKAHIAAIPLRVRGEIIGVLEIERGGDQPWGDIELQMAEELVDRLGLAVENARLFEQATEAAQREQVVNRIAQDVQRAQSIDEVLQAALADISDVLGASRGIVQIRPRDDQPANQVPASRDADA